MPLTFIEFFAKHGRGRTFNARQAVNAAYHEMTEDGVLAADTELALRTHGIDPETLTADLA